MKYLHRYRLLLFVYGLALLVAAYEFSSLKHPAATVSGLAQPPASADVLIELYPDSELAKVLKADQEMYFKYDLQAAKRLLEDALIENHFKGDESYYYNYAAILMLLKEDEESSPSQILNEDVGILGWNLWFVYPRPDILGESDFKRSKVDHAVAEWRRHDLTPDERLDPRVVYKDRELPAALDPQIVRCVVMTRDKKLIVFAYQDNRLQFHDLASFSSVLRPVIAHENVISALALAANERQLVSASLDGDLAVWDLATGQLKHRLLGHRSDVYDLAVFPDGITCASVDRNGWVRIWDLQEGQLLREFHAARKPLSSVAVSADGRWLATASWSGRIKLWSLKEVDAKPRYLVGHHGVVNRLVFTPDSSQLASCSRDKTARIWNVATGKERFVLKGHGAPISRLDVSPDGKLVATASEDRTVKIWSVAEGKVKRTLTLREMPRPMHTVLFAPDNSEIISNGDRGGLQFFRLLP